MKEYQEAISSILQTNLQKTRAYQKRKDLSSDIKAGLEEFYIHITQSWYMNFTVQELVDLFAEHHFYIKLICAEKGFRVIYLKSRDPESPWYIPEEKP